VRGRASWPRNPATCASAHSPVHDESGEGGTDKVGPRRRERKGGRAGATTRHWQTEPARQRERERAGEENRRRQVGPTGQRAREGGRARGRTNADRRGPPIRRRGRAAWLGLVGQLGCFLLFFFSGFSNSFSISFSTGFLNTNSN
jgi:hypothetical protein